MSDIDFPYPYTVDTLPALNAAPTPLTNFTAESVNLRFLMFLMFLLYNSMTFLILVR